MEILIPLAIFVPLGIMIIFALTKSFPQEERSWLLTLLITALLLRVALATAFATFPELRVFHADAVGYEDIGLYLASVWRGEAPMVELAATNSGYHYFAGAICYVFGRYRANVSMVNAVLGTLLALLVYDLTRKLFHHIVARRAALFVAVMPSMVLWGSMALKDLPVTFCIVVSLSSCVDLKQRFTARAALGTFLPILAIYPMRFYIVYFVVFAIVVSMILDRSLSQLTGVYRQVLVLAMFAGLFLLLGFADQAESDASQYASLEMISRYRRGMAETANSGFYADVDISRPDSALMYLPIGLAHLLLAPFPWQMTSLGPLIAAPETIFWWTLVPATIRGIAFSVRNRFSSSLPLLAFTATLTAVYSLTQGNVGAAFRQRAQILVFLFIFSAVGFYLAKARAAGLDPRLLLQNPEPEPGPAAPPALPGAPVTTAAATFRS
jgi:4-amino-4-deoxy-L-arabinose transferase-like glycosyltransferase